jgi:DNA-binding NtrC family response regulator
MTTARKRPTHGPEQAREHTLTAAMTTPSSSVTPPDASDARRLRILVVDDDRTLREGCANILRIDGHDVAAFGRGDEAIEAASRRHFDVALVDLYMTPVGGLDVLRAINAADPATLVVVMTGNPTVASSLDALRAGAWDYLPKPFAASHLQVLVGRAAHAAKGNRPARELRSEPGTPVGEDEEQLLGGSASFRQAVTMAKRVAPTDASVMIFGESGTGKELIAQFIHKQSRRATRKLVAVNCAALPEPLLESEMFGHKKGAFTGADRDKPGLLEMANGGTLFLDELGEMPMTVQAKLLRVLQDGVVRRVGSEKQDTVVNVRFIAATNRDPHEAVREGLLREDLFYRLCVVPLRLPSLRQRPDDIGLLAEHFLARFWRRHRGGGAAMPRFNEECMAFLRSRPWPGNVRQLQNVIEHVTVIAEAGKDLSPDDVPLYEEATPEIGGGRASFLPNVLNDSFHNAKDSVIAHFEREYLVRLTARTGGNMSKAARLAGIDRTTLYRLMEKHGLRREDAHVPMLTASGE